MASYYCDYIGDDSRTYQRVRFDVYLVSVTVGTRGTRSSTSLQDDADTLPPILLSTLTPIVPKQAYCTLPFTYRNALIWTSRNSYIHCPIPWQPNSLEFNTFINEIKSANSNLSTGINGEFIESSYLEFRVKNG